MQNIKIPKLGPHSSANVCVQWDDQLHYFKVESATTYNDLQFGDLLDLPENFQISRSGSDLGEVISSFRDITPPSGSVSIRKSSGVLAESAVYLQDHQTTLSGFFWLFRDEYARSRVIASNKENLDRSAHLYLCLNGPKHRLFYSFGCNHRYVNYSSCKITCQTFSNFAFMMASEGRRWRPFRSCRMNRQMKLEMGH